jgi:hypothetical protein
LRALNLWVRFYITLEKILIDDFLWFCGRNKLLPKLLFFLVLFTRCKHFFLRTLNKFLHSFFLLQVLVILAHLITISLIIFISFQKRKEKLGRLYIVISVSNLKQNLLKFIVIYAVQSAYLHLRENIFRLSKHNEPLLRKLSIFLSKKWLILFIWPIPVKYKVLVNKMSHFKFFKNIFNNYLLLLLSVLAHNNLN